MLRNNSDKDKKLENLDKICYNQNSLNAENVYFV